MSEDWLEAQSKAVVSSPIEASQRDQLDGLIAKLPQLGTSASLCSQLAGCDPLTPKVLSSLGQVRNLLELLPIEQLSSRVQSLIRLHAISARKRRLEESLTRPSGLADRFVPRMPRPCVKSFLPSRL